MLERDFVLDQLLLDFVDVDLELLLGAVEVVGAQLGARGQRLHLELELVDQVGVLLLDAALGLVEAHADDLAERLGALLEHLDVDLDLGGPLLALLLHHVVEVLEELRVDLVLRRALLLDVLLLLERGAELLKVLLDLAQLGRHLLRGVALGLVLGLDGLADGLDLLRHVAALLLVVRADGLVVDELDVAEDVVDPLVGLLVVVAGLLEGDGLQLGEVLELHDNLLALLAL